MPFGTARIKGLTVGLPPGALEKVRAICAALDGAVETTSFGHPTWKLKKKSFAVVEKYKGDWSLALMAEPEQQRALIATDKRFYATPYLGQKGWVSFKLQGRIPWARLRALLNEAHLLAS
jgi:predicted DNA-binding protein (MmcQ/YjbR family)